MGALENIQQALPQAQAKRTQAASCGFSNNDNSGLFFVTVFAGAVAGGICWAQGTNVGDPIGPQADIPIRLPFKCRKFRIASIEQGFGNDDRYMSLRPLGITYSAGGSFQPPFPAGTENWFPLNGSERIDRPAPVIVLKESVDQIWLHLNVNSGSQYTLTLLCYNGDLDAETQFGFDYH